MRFCLIFSVACLATFTQATFNFQSQCNLVDNQMSSLGGSIDQIQAVAQGLGHWRITSKCDEARSHLNYARSSWGGITSGFLSFPWLARTSSHANTVKRRLSSCGTSLQWLYGQPELKHPFYAPHIASCKSQYQSCQSSCQQVWNWPTPSGYQPPQPSQAYGSYRRRVKRGDNSSCPANEVACPISNESDGIECLDTQTELTSCGGCVTKSEGENCLLIPGAQGVGCLHGSCVILSVQKGYKLDAAGRPTPI